MGKIYIERLTDEEWKALEKMTSSLKMAASQIKHTPDYPSKDCRAGAPD